jgi:hypothetical protein
MIRSALALLLLGGCATTEATREMDARQSQRLERELAGLSPGAPMHCLRRDQANEIRTFQGTILYVAGRNRIYRNDVVGGCAGLARGDIVVSKTFGGEYCSGDIIETRAPNGIGGANFTGSCSLGEFVPYTR